MTHDSVRHGPPDASSWKVKDASWLHGFDLMWFRCRSWWTPHSWRWAGTCNEDYIVLVLNDNQELRIMHLYFSKTDIDGAVPHGWMEYFRVKGDLDGLAEFVISATSFLGIHSKWFGPTYVLPATTITQMSTAGRAGQALNLVTLMISWGHCGPPLGFEDLDGRVTRVFMIVAVEVDDGHFTDLAVPSSPDRAMIAVGRPWCLH